MHIQVHMNLHSSGHYKQAGWSGQNFQCLYRSRYRKIKNMFPGLFGNFCMCAKKTFPKPLHHQPEPLTQGRLSPRIHAFETKPLPYWICHSFFTQIKYYNTKATVWFGHHLCDWTSHIWSGMMGDFFFNFFFFMLTVAISNSWLDFIESNLLNNSCHFGYYSNPPPYSARILLTIIESGSWFTSCTQLDSVVSFIDCPSDILKLVLAGSSLLVISLSLCMLTESANEQRCPVCAAYRVSH